MKPAFLLVAALTLLLLLPTKSVIAKNASIGIYTIADQVTFEPDAGPPKFSPNIRHIRRPCSYVERQLPQPPKRLSLFSDCAGHRTGNTTGLERTQDPRWVG